MNFTKYSIILIAQAIGISAHMGAPYPTTTDSTSPSPVPSQDAGKCNGESFDKVKITSSDRIKAGEPFTITWESDKPDSLLNDTEARVELWAMAGGPARSPVILEKSGRLFRTNNYTYNFSTKYTDYRDGMGPLPLRLYTFVYSTWAWDNSTELPSWFIPYYGSQSVNFY